MVCVHVYCEVKEMSQKYHRSFLGKGKGPEIRSLCALRKVGNLIAL